MPSKGYIWDEEYRERYYASPKVQVHLEAFKQLVKQPKSQETKDAMSAAKKNIAKTQDQKDAMSETQKMRHALKKEVSITHADLSSKEQWALVKTMLKELKDGS